MAAAVTGNFSITKRRMVDMKFCIREEQALGAIISMFENSGFRKFKSGCFEEYSLYRDNESFLVGKNVIAFTDATGRLMAIRPDVTLSLIRRAEIKKGNTEKFFYNEMVYRRAAGGKDFSEIAQIGAEVIGLIDNVCEAELAILMCRTLGIISESFVLDVSDVSYTEGLLNTFGDDKQEVMDYLRRKDVHDFLKLADDRHYPDSHVKAFITAANLNGSNPEAIGKAEECCLNKEMVNGAAELKKLVFRLEHCGFGDKINVNFSMANDSDYYSGLVFNGYIEGVPHCVLTGGRYDNLLHKFGKEGGAIGFAVSLGELERFFPDADNDTDELIIYDQASEDKALSLLNKNTDRSIRLCRKGQEKYFNASRICDLTQGGEV